MEKMWINFVESGLKIASHIISAAVEAKTKNPQAAEATSNNLKLKSGGKVLSMTDKHGNGLRKKVKWF